MQRIVNLHKSFFENPEVSIAQRASDLAFDGGRNPYDIQVLRGMQEDYHRIIPANIPEKQMVYAVDEWLIKKQLRREFKNVPFTSRRIL